MSYFVRRDFDTMESGPKDEFILGKKTDTIAFVYSPHTLGSVVVHFRQLRGNQGFAMDHEKADQFANKASSTTFWQQK